MQESADAAENGKKAQEAQQQASIEALNAPTHDIYSTFQEVELPASLSLRLKLTGTQTIVNCTQDISALLQAVALCVALAGAGAAYIATAESVPSSISHNSVPAQEAGSEDDAPVKAVSVEDWDVDFTMIAPLQGPSAALEPLVSKEGNVAVDPDDDGQPTSQQPHPMPQLYLQYVTASKGQVSWQLVMLRNMYGVLSRRGGCTP